MFFLKNFFLLAIIFFLLMFGLLPKAYAACTYFDYSFAGFSGQPPCGTSQQTVTAQCQDPQACPSDSSCYTYAPTQCCQLVLDPSATCSNASYDSSYQKYNGFQCCTPDIIEATPTPPPLPDCNTGGGCGNCTYVDGYYDEYDNYISNFNTCSRNGTKLCTYTTYNYGADLCTTTVIYQQCDVDMCVSGNKCDYSGIPSVCVSDPLPSSSPIYQCDEIYDSGYRTTCVNGSECPAGATAYTASPDTSCGDNQVCCIIPPISATSTPSPTPSPTPTVLYTISGTVFVDLNENGVQDGEQGYPGRAEITVTGGTLTAAKKTTSSGGGYSVSVPGGTYSVKLTVPTSDSYTLSSRDTNSKSASVGQNAPNATANFGVIPPTVCDFPTGLIGSCDYNINLTPGTEDDYILNFSWDNNVVCKGYEINITDRTDTTKNKTASVVAPLASYSTAGTVDHVYDWAVTAKYDLGNQTSTPSDGTSFQCLAPAPIPIVINPLPGGTTPTPTPAFAGGTGPFFTVTGFVWEDTDIDNAKDNGEDCYAGDVQVSLKSPSGTLVQSPISYTQDRQCNNKYKFTKVLQGSYYVILSSPETPEGINGYDSTSSKSYGQGGRIRTYSWLKSVDLSVP